MRRRRTAAVTRIAFDTFGRADSKVLAVFGTGVQAKAHLRAIVENSSIERVLIVGIEGVPETITHMQALSERALRNWQRASCRERCGRDRDRNAEYRAVI
jgi:ornithine cyclodeaminase/alanine dehydrogenase-like protein (mu-crystallin family)